MTPLRVINNLANILPESVSYIRSFEKDSSPDRKVHISDHNILCSGAINIVVLRGSENIITVSTLLEQSSDHYFLLLDVFHREPEEDLFPQFSSCLKSKTRFQTTIGYLAVILDVNFLEDLVAKLTSKVSINATSNYFSMKRFKIPLPLQQDFLFRLDSCKSTRTQNTSSVTN